MTTPEGRDPAVVLRADVSAYIASLTQAERATLRLATSIKRDMAGSTAAINQATVALRAYAAAANTVGARVPGQRGVTTAGRAPRADTTVREAARTAAQRERIEASVTRATKAREQETERSADRTAAVMRRTSNHIEESLRDMARTVAITGVALTAGLIISARAAIEWETAWTGVRKTVNGSPEEMAALEKELRNLATTLPSTHKEIAGIAEAAGQMGVAKENISSFTRTVVELSQTTNLSADAAATGLAKFTNVMGTLPSETRRLASTLVGLGNAGASTEADILSMAQRVAGAGKTIGLTEDQVLALSSATSDLGIEAELGGGALQRVMLDTYKAVKKGGDELERFASIARDATGAQLTGAGFADLFNSNPAAALQALIRGLREVQDQGGNTVAAMNAIGAEGTLDISVLTRLTGGIGVLNDALDTSAKAWRRPIDLLEEFEKRAETTASKIQVARNQLKDLAIDVGGAVLPDVASGASAIKETASAAQSLPGPLGLIALESAKAVVLLGLLSTVLLVFAAKMAASVLIARALSTTMPRLAAAVTFLRNRFLLLVAAMAALGAADVGIKKWTASIDDATGRTADVVALRRSLLDLVDASREADKGDGGGAAKGIKATGEAARLWGESLQGFRKDVEAASDPSWGDRFNKLAVDIENAVSKPFGFELGTAASDVDRYLGRVNDMAEAAKRLNDGFDQVLADFVNNGLVGEAAVLIEDFAKANQMSLEEVIAIAPKYRDAVKGAALQADVTARSNERLGKSGEKAGDGLNAGAIDAETFEKTLKKITPAWLDLDKAQLKNAERWKDIRDQAKDAADALDDVRGSVRDTVSEMQSGESSIDSFESALMDLRDTDPGDSGSVDRSLDGFTEAAIRNREAVRGLVNQAGDMITANIRAGASFDDVAAQTQQYEQYLGGQLTQMGYFGPAVQKMLDPLRQIPGAYQQAQKAATGYGTAEDQQLSDLDKRVKFGEMLQERLETLRAKNEAAQTDPSITPATQTQFAAQQAAELAAQMEAMGASAGQIAEFTKPITDLADVTKSGPTVDTSQAKKAQEDLLATGEATRIANEWTAKPKVDPNGVKAGLDEITSSVNDFLKTPAGQLYLNNLPKDQQDKLRDLMEAKDTGVAGKPAGGGGLGRLGQDVTKALNWVGTRPLELIPGIGWGFASGGFTGAGGKDEPAGTVHKGEFVIDAAKTRDWLPLLNAIHSGRVSPRLMDMLMGHTGAGGPWAPGYGSARGPGGGLAVGQWSRGMANVKLKYGHLGFDPFGRNTKVAKPQRGYADGGLVTSRYQSMHAAPAAPVINVQAGGGQGIDYDRLAQAMTRVNLRVEGNAYMDHRQVGTVMGRQADLTADSY